MKALPFLVTKKHPFFIGITGVLVCMLCGWVSAQSVSIEPDSLNLNSSNTFSITNNGTQPLHYVMESNTSFRSFHSSAPTEINNLPVHPGPNGIEAIPNTALWLANTEPGWGGDVNLNTSIYTIQWNSPFHVAFEELGWDSNLNTQDGWAAEGDTWHVNRPGRASDGSTEYQYYFKFFFTGLSDGSNVPSGMFSPRVVLGSENVSSVSMEVNLLGALGSTWQIIPQSLTSGNVVTRLQINPDGTFQVLVKNNLGQASFQKLSVAAPLEHLKIGIEVDRATFSFTLFFNDQKVFAGQGFSNTVDQLGVLALNEKAGSIFEMNGDGWNFDSSVNLNGASSLVFFSEYNPDEYFFTQSNQVERYLEPVQSVVEELVFSESDLLPGVYRDSIKISTNDPNKPLLFLPYAFAVERPYQPPSAFYSSAADLQLPYDTLEATIYNGDVATVTATVNNTSSAERLVYFPKRSENSKILAFSHGSQSFQWIEISTIGTALTLGDDDSQPVQMPFAFPFAHGLSDFITIGSNGYLKTGITQADDPAIRTFQPDFESLPNTIGPFWCDFAPDDASGIYYWGDDERFVVQYNNVPIKGTALRNTFEAIFYPDGAIQFQYLHVNDQLRASIGIGGSTNFRPINIAYKEPWIKDSLAILFQPQRTDVYDFETELIMSEMFPWIHYPEEGSALIGPGSHNVDIQLSGMPVGVSKGRILLQSKPPSEVQSTGNDEIIPYDAGTLMLPVKVTVLENPLPVIDSIPPVSLYEGESKDILLTATDLNDAQVQISIDSLPEFITLVETQDGSVQYKISPVQGDAGEYALVVRATDPHHAFDVDTLYLTVLPPNAVVDFSLTYFKTGVVVSTFDQHITLDVADPNIEKYTVRANTIGKVGSVKFLLDGRKINVDNTEPFTINAWALPVLSSGLHTLVAQSFSKNNAKGDLNNSKELAIYITNSAAITSFYIVDRNGNKIKDIVDGEIIPAGQPEFSGFNIMAYTNISAVRSVRFLLNGITARIDNRAPYAVSGKANGNDTPWSINPGTYTLTAIPYMKYYAWGPEGVPLSLHFTVTHNTAPAANLLAQEEIKFENSNLSLNSEGQKLLLVYPNPVGDEMNISLSNVNDGKFILRIMNAKAQVVYTMEGNAQTVQEQIISTRQLGMTAGIYYIQLIGTNGFNEVNKFIKQ